MSYSLPIVCEEMDLNEKYCNFLYWVEYWDCPLISGYGEEMNSATDIFSKMSDNV